MAKEIVIINERGHYQQKRLNELIAEVGLLQIEKEDSSAAQKTVDRLEYTMKGINADLDS